MKLQNMMLILVIVLLPLVILLSYYISLQKDTINLQARYNTGLVQSAQSSISAFEINTVEWNESFSNVGDSRRRDVMAAINTFNTMFANNIGIAGASRENMLNYIPAISYTLYDGVYIYSPSEVKKTIKDDNGLTVFMTEKITKDGSIEDYSFKPEDEGKILYVCQSDKSPNGTYKEKAFTLDPDKAEKTYSHVLKPFTTYSAFYEKGNKDIVVDYTLDNYITVHRKVGSDYVEKSGYFIDNHTIEPAVGDNYAEGIKVDGTLEIEPEELTEKIAYTINPDGPVTTNTYHYVYVVDENVKQTKVYFDNDAGNTPFQVSATGLRTNIKDISSKYKKIVLKSDQTIYQEITTGELYNEDGSHFTEININIDKKKDYSAINYYLESKEFSKWVSDELSDIEVVDMKGDKSQIAKQGKIFKNPENDTSVFNEHKREIIKQIIISNLNQAITSYSRNNQDEQTYRLPVLSETDWDKILKNVSIIAFVQNIPIGLKYYNNYIISTSTRNKEYVDPDEIYLNVTDPANSDIYYHLPYCNENEGDKFIGYRNIDYVRKSYEDSNGTPEDSDDTTEYYYKHQDMAQQSCYNCFSERPLKPDPDEMTDNMKEQWRAYETALARERYVSKDTE